MTMPNFFIVGAQKAGTTSLYHYLNQHPQVYMSPIKEPFFFDHEMDSKGEVVRREFEGHRQPPRFTNIEEYSALFEGVRGEKAIIDLSHPSSFGPHSLASHFSLLTSPCLCTLQT